MDFRKVGFNAAAAFSFAFFTALAAGQSAKVAAALGVGAVIANLTGLFQDHPAKG